GRASRRQDRIARIGMGGVPGDCARASRPDIGLEQPAASLRRCRRTDENGFGCAVQAVGDWDLRPPAPSCVDGTAQRATAACYLRWILQRSSVIWSFWLMKPVAVPSAPRFSSPWAFQSAIKRKESLPPLMGEK